MGFNNKGVSLDIAQLLIPQAGIGIDKVGRVDLGQHINVIKEISDRLDDNAADADITSGGKKDDEIDQGEDGHQNRPDGIKRDDKEHHGEEGRRKGVESGLGDNERVIGFADD